MKSEITTGLHPDVIRVLKTDTWLFNKKWPAFTLRMKKK
jgi:hypothetical protein